jgi:DNA repair protein RadA/Sms
VASSLRNRAIRPGTAVFGEVGLAGEIRGTAQVSARVREAAQMGFTRVVLPEVNVTPDDVPPGCELVAVKNVGEALDQLIDW